MQLGSQRVRGVWVEAQRRFLPQLFSQDSGPGYTAVPDQSTARTLAAAVWGWMDDNVTKILQRRKVVGCSR